MREGSGERAAQRRSFLKCLSPACLKEAQQVPYLAQHCPERELPEAVYHSSRNNKTRRGKRVDVRPSIALLRGSLGLSPAEVALDLGLAPGSGLAQAPATDPGRAA